MQERHNSDVCVCVCSAVPLMSQLRRVLQLEDSESRGLSRICAQHSQKLRSEADFQLPRTAVFHATSQHRYPTCTKPHKHLSAHKCCLAQNLPLCQHTSAAWHNTCLFVCQSQWHWQASTAFNCMGALVRHKQPFNPQNQVPQQNPKSRCTHQVPQKNPKSGCTA